MAKVDDSYHVHVFDRDGNRVTDLNTNGFPDDDLREKLDNLFRNSTTGTPINLGEQQKSDLILYLSKSLKQSLGNDWLYERVIPIYKFSKKAGKGGEANIESLPASSDPYRGIGSAVLEDFSFMTFSGPGIAGTSLANLT